MTAFDGALVFRGNRQAGVVKLFRFEPSSGRTSQLCDTRGDAALSDEILIYGECAGRLYFRAKSPANRTEIHRL